MTTVATLTAKLEADIRDFDKKIKSAEQRLDDLENTTGDASDAAQGLGSRFGALAGKATMVAGGVAAAGAVVYSTVSSFSDLEESINAVNVQFGEGADTILAFGETAAEQVGLSNAAFNQLAVVTGATLSSFIEDEQAAAAETINLTQRAADMASVFNTDVNEALVALQAAIRGEMEPIRRFGVSLDDASIRAHAVAMGLAETTSEVTIQQKQMAALQLIYEQTEKTAGDFANTSGSLANRQRVLASRFEDAKAAVGEGLVPAMEALLSVVENMIPLLEKAATGLANFVSGATEFGLRLRTLFGNLPGEYAEVEANQRGVNRAIQDGVPVVQALAEGYANIQEKGDLTAIGMGELATAVGATSQEMDQAIVYLAAHAEELGFTGEAYEQLQFEAGIAALRLEEAGEAARDNHYEQLAADIAKAERGHRNAATAADGYVRSLQATATEIRKMTDPAFRLQQANEKLSEAEGEVIRLRQEGKTNTEEFETAVSGLLEAQGELNAAQADFNAVGEEGITMLYNLGQQSILTKDEVDKLIQSLLSIEGLRLPPVPGVSPGATGPTAPTGRGPVANAVVNAVPMVNVYVSGSVTSQQDLVTSVRDGLIEMARAGSQTDGFV